MNKYDVAIIGSGPSGYVASIRAAQLGMRVSLFEKEKVGGVCLNWGCVPTKVLSVSSAHLYNICNASVFGIDIERYKLDYQKIFDRKESIVKKLAGNIEFLIKSKKIDLIKHAAKIKDPTHIEADGAAVETKNILIAAGSAPFELPGFKFNRSNILSSTDLLDLKSVPKSLIIVGGGVIGCEFASIFNNFGSSVTIIEMMESLLPAEDREISRKLEQVFKKRGINVLTKTKVENINNSGISLEAVLSNGSSVSAEKLLVAVGRSCNLKGFGAEEIGLELNKGWIKVDNFFRTNIKNIYAAGDVIGGVLLAHAASREGISAVEAMSGRSPSINYNIIPNTIFTHPEIASVGLTENMAKEKGLEVSTRKFLFSSIGKAHILGETEGFVKIVVDNSDKIIGAQIIGHGATELIAEFSPCIQFGITSEKLASVIHAHPTLSEIVQEVCESVHGKAIHSIV